MDVQSPKPANTQRRNFHSRKHWNRPNVCVMFMLQMLIATLWKYRSRRTANVPPHSAQYSAMIQYVHVQRDCLSRSRMAEQAIERSQKALDAEFVNIFASEFCQRNTYSVFGDTWRYLSIACVINKCTCIHCARLGCDGMSGLRVYGEHKTIISSTRSMNSERRHFKQRRR